MSSLTAAVVISQIGTIEERVNKYNKRYYMMAERLNKHPNMQVPMQSPKVRICGDSIQFNLQDVTDDQVAKFVTECKTQGLPVELFGSKANARNFVNWKFSPAEDPLPRT